MLQRTVGLVVVALIGTVACSSASTRASDASAIATHIGGARPLIADTAVAHATGTGVCGNGTQRPKHYTSVVVFAFENRSWDDVGLGFGTGMPYLHALGRRCALLPRLDRDRHASEQPHASTSGRSRARRRPGTVDDCSPSSQCSTQANNIFRQAREVGKTAINYVEGATKPCSAAGNAAKHIPALYMWQAGDRAHCTAQVRPFSEFRPDPPPELRVRYADAVQRRSRLRQRDRRPLGQGARAAGAQQRRVQGRQGRGLHLVRRGPPGPEPVDHADCDAPGAHALAGAGYAGTLRAWESMLGFPCLARACTAPDMRAAANG